MLKKGFFPGLAVHFSGTTWGGKRTGTWAALWALGRKRKIMSESWFGHNFSTVATGGEERGKRQRRHEYNGGGGEGEGAIIRCIWHARSVVVGLWSKEEDMMGGRKKKTHLRCSFASLLPCMDLACCLSNQTRLKCSVAPFKARTTQHTRRRPFLFDGLISWQ